MSDFIARIAARAVGEAPAARPRLPSTFEDAGPSGKAVLEVVEAELPAPRSASPLRGPAAARDAPVQPPELEPAGPPHRPGSRKAAAPGIAARGDAARRAAPGPDFEPARGEPERVPAVTPGPEPEPASVEAAAFVSATAGPVSAARAPAVAAAAVAVPRAVHPSEPGPAPVAVEPPPVRVHIGRLEVRANLQQPPPPRQSTRGEERPQELSLADYLRGRRVGS